MSGEDKVSVCLQKKKAAGLVEGMYTVRRLRDRRVQEVVTVLCVVLILSGDITEVQQ